MAAQCPLTFSVVNSPSNSAYSGSFVAVDSSGNLEVDTNTKSTVNVKVKWEYYHSDPLTKTAGYTP